MSPPTAAGALFVAICVAGSSAAVALAVREARSVAAVQARVVRTVRSGLVTTVTSEVRNETDRSRCVWLRVIARDRGGADLAGSTAVTVELTAHASRRVTATVTMTSRQYAEQLSQLHPVPTSCAAERP